MYIISKLTGKIYLNGLEIPLDDSKQEFQQYLIDKDIVGTLSWFGKVICKILDTIDKNHCEKSIQW